eukprot:2587082-Rhodomonas_salina.1
MKTKRKSVACISAPRFAGDRKPRHANTSRIAHDTHSCAADKSSAHARQRHTRQCCAHKRREPMAAKLGH